MLDIVIGVVAFLLGLGIGKYGLTAAEVLLKQHAATKAVTNAKALIAQAEANAKALEQAKALVAAQPAAPASPTKAS